MIGSGGRHAKYAKDLPKLTRGYPIRMTFQGIFLTGDKFSADFSSGEGVPPGL